MTLKQELMEGDWVLATHVNGQTIEGQATRSMGAVGSAILTLRLSESECVDINVNQWDVVTTKVNWIARARALADTQRIPVDPEPASRSIQARHLRVGDVMKDIILGWRQIDLIDRSPSGNMQIKMGATWLILDPDRTVEVRAD